MSLLDRRRGRELTESQREWIRVREYLMAHRHELGQQAVDLYADMLKVADTPLLGRPDWLPPSPSRCPTSTSRSPPTDQTPGSLRTTPRPTPCFPCGRADPGTGPTPR